jgi:hypothetical protein
VSARSPRPALNVPPGLRNQVIRARGAACEGCDASGVYIHAEYVRTPLNGGSPTDHANVRLMCNCCRDHAIEWRNALLRAGLTMGGARE